MSTRQFPARLVFGRFEVNVPADELRKGGVRVQLSHQPMQILLLLLAHPGDVVTREQLREELWSEGTFVDFERGLNSAMNKLRRALSDSAENPRYIETVPGSGYRFVAALEQRNSVPSRPVATSVVHEELHRTRRVRPWWWVAFGVACVFSFVIGSRWPHHPATYANWKPTRLTADAGLSDAPALSADGKLLAYSSDRSSAGEWDLYVQQVAGGQPIRLTFDGANNTSPDFSPDGSKVVFHSNRDGGGIYEIPAFGGEVRLVARDGINPRFSPDGSQVAYWIGAPNIASSVPGSGAVRVVSVAGGQPRKLGPNFTAASYPIWSPDSKHLLVIGYASNKAYDSTSIDWWLTPIDGGNAMKTGAYDALFRAGLRGRPNWLSRLPNPDVPIPNCWLADSNDVIFSAQSGDTSNVWEIGLSPVTGKIAGEFKRITAGAGNELEPSCASANFLAFTNIEIRRNLWSLPFELNRGRPDGGLERMTQGPANREHASLSRDGKYAAFASAQAGPLNIWVRELATGKEIRVAESSFVQRFPVISPSGRRIAYSSYEYGKRVVYVSVPGGTPEKLCDPCFRATDWSRDEKTLLIFAGDPYEVDLIDATSHQRTPLLKKRTDRLLYARFSPDNRWISFTERIQPNRARVMIAPIVGPKPIPESAWIEITEEAAEDWANWSPDGKTLYFTSGRDGHFCLWGQRIDPRSHKPRGDAFPVQHLHGRVLYEQGGWSAAGGRIAMVLVERTGNIWMMSRSRDR